MNYFKTLSLFIVTCFFINFASPIKVELFNEKGKFETSKFTKKIAALLEEEPNDTQKTETPLDEKLTKVKQLTNILVDLKYYIISIKYKLSEIENAKKINKPYFIISQEIYEIGKEQEIFNPTLTRILFVTKSEKDLKKLIKKLYLESKIEKIDLLEALDKN